MTTPLTDWHDMRIGFIGAGRLATGLALALIRHGVPVTAVASRRDVSAARFAHRIPGCRQMPAADLAAHCGLIFITVPDDAIADVARGTRWRDGMFVVHCSGATELSALQAAADGGAQIGGFHPMQAFTDPDSAAATLPGCTVSIEAEQPLRHVLEELAARLQCNHIALPSGCRARYHAAAGYASQHINVMMREASHIFASFGIDEAAAVRALLPLLKGIVASIETQGIAQGMPGPVSRGDLGTVQRHVAALESMGGDSADLYRELTRRSIALALERGSIDTTKADALRAALQKP
jgi:predicted short-subunit dehydrogenase-like oxidoreductase (DUF2520 family)